MKKNILVIPILFLITIPSVAQFNKIECDSLYKHYSKARENKIGLITFEKAPELIGSNQQLRINLKNGISADDGKRVFIRFIVDRTGEPQCIESIKGDNKLLKIAKERVKELKFSPAVLRGETLTVPMTLPFIFKIK